MYYDGVYEAGTLAVMRQSLRGDDTVLDVGATIGLMWLEAARRVRPESHAYAIEPEPETFALLKRNQVLNRADTRRIG